MASSASRWPELLSDILWLIIQRLPIADYVRFGAVCGVWRASLAEKKHRPAPQVPWLMISHPASKTSSSSRIEFLSLSENSKEYHIDLPPEFDHGHMLIGSSNGCLISVDEAWDVHMFDPISRSHARLRSAVTDFPDKEAWDAYILLGEEIFRRHYFTKIVFQSPTSSKTKLVVAAISCYSDKLVIVAQRDESRWSWATMPAPVHDYKFDDIIFYRDQLFAIDRCGWVGACDISDPSHPKVSFSARPPSNWHYDVNYHKFLVQYLSGDLLHVSLPRRRYTAVTPIIRVFKTDPTSRGEKKWVELRSFGDHAIFSYYNQSFILSTRDFPELKRNGIYIAHDSSDNRTFDDLPLWFTPIVKF